MDDKKGFEMVLLEAIKSEVDSKEVYLKLSKMVKNALLSDKLRYLAHEENYHKTILENMYKEYFPGKKIILPKKTNSPLPELVPPAEDDRVVDVFRKAMETEMAAHDYYLEAANKYLKDDDKRRDLLIYLATMEMGHYKLLELEIKSLEELGDIYMY